MDSITHVALGAVVGEALGGKTLGKRAMYIGALAQSLPDIDFLAVFWLSPADNLLAHRGITHSFLFAVVATLSLAYLGYRTHPTHRFSYGQWSLLFGVEILIHLLIDACNAYGVGWFEPFNDIRISLHVLFVADPLYSVWPFISMMVLIYLSSKSPARRFWIWFGIIGSTGYFIYAVTNKLEVEREVKESLANQQLTTERFFTTPTPLNSWLWYVVAEDNNGFFTTYRAVADEEDDPLKFQYFPSQHAVLEPYENQHDIRQLRKFSQGYYTVSQKGDTLLFNDLRFGQIAGWTDPKAGFVFHYYINYPEANLMVIQRGRFSNWNRKTFNSLIQRIKGHQ